MDKNPTTNSLKSQNPSKPLSNDDRCVKKPHQSGINPPDDDAVAMDLSSSALHNKEPYTNYPNMVIPPHALSDFNVVASNMVGQNSCMQTGTEVIETMEGIENTITAPPSIGQRPFSYKVALLGPNIDQVHDDDDTQEDDDIDLLEGDVIRITANGMASIDFSTRIQTLAEKIFNQTVVVKLLGRKLGYTVLQTKVLDLWKPTEQVQIMDIENDYFLSPSDQGKTT
ncbi:hypothetical protein V6N11_008786 [Hibiscus sabdariffa]|uniref:Uncharacterized protein n=2 Tax=Hibiscus sabdariffa TaxID=183260 RepID=A0ABR2NQN2_9ROSI